MAMSIRLGTYRTKPKDFRSLMLGCTGEHVEIWARDDDDKPALVTFDRDEALRLATFINEHVK